MNNRTKKWALVSVCLLLCVVMVALIARGFTAKPIPDAPPLIAGDDPATDISVTVSASPAPAPSAPPIEVKPQPIVIPPSPQTPADNGGDSIGTEQTFQPDVTKPTPDEEALKDPTKTPDGTPVSEPPTVDHTEKHDPEVTPTPKPTPPPTPEPTPKPTKKPSDEGSSGGGLPGFENIPYGGPNEFEYLEDMYENGNKIGIMD
jgi:hypothetical protein